MSIGFLAPKASLEHVEKSYGAQQCSTIVQHSGATQQYHPAVQHSYAAQWRSNELQLAVHTSSQSVAIEAHGLQWTPTNAGLSLRLWMAASFESVVALQPS